MEWKISDGITEYEDAIAQMEARVAAIHAGDADDLIWLLEHRPLYTAGTSAKEEDLLEDWFPVHQTGRGGQYTYHGPGQRIAYVMMDLKKRQQKTLYINHAVLPSPWSGRFRSSRVSGGGGIPALLYIKRLFSRSSSLPCSISA